jgi:hypothetical protein
MTETVCIDITTQCIVCCILLVRLEASPRKWRCIKNKKEKGRHHLRDAALLYGEQQRGLPSHDFSPFWDLWSLTRLRVRRPQALACVLCSMLLAHSALAIGNTLSAFAALARADFVAHVRILYKVLSDSALANQIPSEEPSPRSPSCTCLEFHYP